MTFCVTGTGSTYFGLRPWQRARILRSSAHPGEESARTTSLNVHICMYIYIYVLSFLLSCIYKHTDVYVQARNAPPLKHPETDKVLQKATSGGTLLQCTYNLECITMASSLKVHLNGAGPYCNPSLQFAGHVPIILHMHTHFHMASH